MNSFFAECRFDSQFGGETYECLLGTPNTEHYIRCSLGADTSALYILSKLRNPMRWYHYLYRQSWGLKSITKHDLRIPWDLVQCRAGNIFFKKVIWFENRERRVYFFVARDVGEKLLADARRPMPQ